MPYEITKSEWSYLAGLIDGEGYIGLVKQIDSRPNRGRAIYYHPRIAVTMTHKETINFLFKKLPGYYYISKDTKNGRWKPRHKWQIKADLKSIKHVCCNLLKYSITKKKQIVEMIKYCDRRINMKKAYCGHPTITEKDHKIYRNIKQLNQTGV